MTVGLGFSTSACYQWHVAGERFTSMNPGVTNFQSFFQDVSYPPSSLYHLLPLHVIHLPSQLRTATRFTRPISCTKNIVPSLITHVYVHMHVLPVTVSESVGSSTVQRVSPLGSVTARHLVVGVS